MFNLFLKNRKSKFSDDIFTTPELGSTLWIDSIDALELNSKSNASSLVKFHTQEIIENGYTVIKGVHSKSDCLLAIKSFENFIDRNINYTKEFITPDNHLPRIINLHVALPSLTDLFTSATVPLEVQDYIFKHRTCLYTSLFFQRGSQQDLHRDTPYFYTVPFNFYLGMWNALEDVDSKNGPLRVVAGSHRLPDIDRSKIADLFYKKNEKIPSTCQLVWNEYQRQAQEQAREMDLVEHEIHVNAGDVVIWHPSTIHGGSSILDSNRTRYSWVCHTTPYKVPVYHQDSFFRPEKELSTSAPWNYIDIGSNRRIVEGDHVNINHKLDLKLKDIL